MAGDEDNQPPGQDQNAKFTSSTTQVEQMANLLNEGQNFGEHGHTLSLPNLMASMGHTLMDAITETTNVLTLDEQLPQDRVDRFKGQLAKTRKIVNEIDLITYKVNLQAKGQRQPDEKLITAVYNMTDATVFNTQLVKESDLRTVQPFDGISKNQIRKWKNS